jgi:hypothetical protein
MRAKNREVNIFNMSLLDILTGMLGAFLFLMLGLIPYYTRAKDQNPNSQNQNQTPPIDLLFNVVGQWSNGAKLDLFLLQTNGIWRGDDTKSMPLSRMAKIENNCCMSGLGWQSTSVYASTGQRYLLACSLQPSPDHTPAPDPLFLSFTQSEIESDPQGAGMKSYDADAFGTFISASGAQVGNVYGLYWITPTQDQSKQDYAQQYDFTAHPVKPSDRLPRGVLPLPSAPSAPPMGRINLGNVLGAQPATPQH